MNLGKKIKELRTERGISQSKLAQGIGYAQSIITEWELGRKRPIADAIIALARYFDVTTDYLLGLECEDGTKETNLIFTEEEKKLFELYKPLNIKIKHEFLDFMSEFVENAEKREKQHKNKP